MGNDWFADLTGFTETTYESTRSKLEARDGRLRSLVNERTYGIGRLETPSLRELRRLASREAPRLHGRISVGHVTNDVRELLGDARNASALFQVASQFNLLEMTGPSLTPEMGVSLYARDITQGTACAMAAGAATIYRNYLVPVDGRAGQTLDRQIDCLADLGTRLGNARGNLWRMHNGYAMCSVEGLQEISKRIESASLEEVDELRADLRIGLHWDVEITRGAHVGHEVSQALCSALPVAYSRARPALWETFARLVLESAYEATLHAAVLNAARTGNRTVYLTSLGGGVFGNVPAWITNAMERAFELFAEVALDVKIVRYGSLADADGRGRSRL